MPYAADSSLYTGGFGTTGLNLYLGRELGEISLADSGVTPTAPADAASSEIYNSTNRYTVLPDLAFILGLMDIVPLMIIIVPETQDFAHDRRGTLLVKLRVSHGKQTFEATSTLSSPRTNFFKMRDL
ncbi:hypothetical protein EDD16DRAFT_1516852 [Pisolithus croceorrhizus]|nr:hypothetical protein EDD16DRAFT_1516852 [Pisolithus croceorrhizus]KAI6167430.1 hypothetical protein EDD17DRAFT_1504551 [Pisolithus thermaeus]